MTISAYLESDEEVGEIHSSAATEGQSDAILDNENVDTHFVCFRLRSNCSYRTPLVLLYSVKFYSDIHDSILIFLSLSYFLSSSVMLTATFMNWTAGSHSPLIMATVQQSPCWKMLLLS